MCRGLPSVLLPRTSWPYTAAVRYALIGIVLLLCTGCVERRIYVRSEPPGADVYIDGEKVGVTRPENHEDGPFYVTFSYYGSREYTLRKPGYQTQSGTVQLVVPWYEYPPMDLFAEVLAPWIIVDKHEIKVKLEPAKPGDPDEVFRRANQYKNETTLADRFEFAASKGSWHR
jgi:hypothetical protein